jgi:hypothetical protein
MAIRKIVFVSRLREGAEQELLSELKASFPSDALGGIAGLEEVTICQGNGLFAAVIEYDGDFEKIFASYVANPSIQAFHSKVAEFLENVPRATVPSELPLAGDVLYWDGRKVREAVG